VNLIHLLMIVRTRGKARIERIESKAKVRVKVKVKNGMKSQRQ
jgi:hypothetical protein